MTARGDLFILSAPSGAGKTTLIQRMMDGPVGRAGGVVFSVSHTTRAPRQGEVDGEDYHFVSTETFEAMIASGEFLEWEEVHGNYYGTSVAEVTPRRAAGLDVVLDIDVKGAEAVLAGDPEAIGIFVLPPSYEALEARLRSRGLDDPVEIARRLAVSLWEIRRYDHYEYVIINRDVERAGEALASVILARRHRAARRREEAEEVLRDFETAFPTERPAP
jgi:guanylate kinase